MSKTRKAWWPLVALLLYAQAAAVAQEEATLPAAIRKAVREQEPKWELKDSHHAPPEGDQIGFAAFVWRDGDKPALEVFIITSNSPEEAAASFEFLMGEFSVPKFRQRLIRGGLKNLGEDKYLWEDYYASGSGGVTFRHGHFAVRVGSTSKATAERFAPHIQEALKSLR